jgi:hypothetical protein
MSVAEFRFAVVEWEGISLSHKGFDTELAVTVRKLVIDVVLEVERRLSSLTRLELSTHTRLDS